MRRLLPLLALICLFLPTTSSAMVLPLPYAAQAASFQSTSLQPQSDYTLVPVNVYRDSEAEFCRNDPVDFTDPLGLDPAFAPGIPNIFCGLTAKQEVAASKAAAPATVGMLAFVATDGLIAPYLGETFLASVGVGMFSGLSGDAASQGTSLALGTQKGFSTRELAFSGLLCGGLSGGFNVLGRVARPLLEFGPTIENASRLKSAAPNMRTGKGVGDVARCPTSLEQLTPSDFASAYGDAVFQSGRGNLNRLAADASGGTTIGKTTGGQAIDRLVDWSSMTMQESREFASPYSKIFAEQSSGPVRSWAGGTSWESVWRQTELPTLLRNPDVTKITILDAARPEVTRIIYPR